MPKLAILRDPFVAISRFEGFKSPWKRDALWQATTLTRICSIQFLNFASPSGFSLDSCITCARFVGRYSNIRTRLGPFMKYSISCTTFRCANAINTSTSRLEHYRSHISFKAIVNPHAFCRPLYIFSKVPSSILEHFITIEKLRVPFLALHETPISTTPHVWIFSGKAWQGLGFSFSHPPLPCKCVQTKSARRNVNFVIVKHDVNVKSFDHIHVKIFILWTLVISTLANEWPKFLSPSPNLAQMCSLLCISSLWVEPTNISVH